MPITLDMEAIRVSRGEPFEMNMTYRCDELSLFAGVDRQVPFGIGVAPIQLPNGASVGGGRFLPTPGAVLSNESGLARATFRESRDCYNEGWSKSITFVAGPPTEVEVERGTTLTTGARAFYQYPPVAGVFNGTGLVESVTRPIEIVYDRPVVEIVQFTSGFTAPPVPVDFVEIGTWEDGFLGSSLRNGAEMDNFVSRDPRNFYVRVSDPTANQDPETVETVYAYVQTRGGVDDPTRLTLRETSAGPGRPAENSGVFISISQLMTTTDIALVGDDDLPVHDGSDGPVPDDAPGDRTHRARVSDIVRASYVEGGGEPSGGDDEVFTDASVCALGSVKTVTLTLATFQEPFLDWGLDGKRGTNDCGEDNGVFDYCPTGQDCSAACNVLNGGDHELGQFSERYIDYSYFPSNNYVSGSELGFNGPQKSHFGYSAAVAPEDMAGEAPLASALLAQGCMRVISPSPPVILEAPMGEGDRAGFLSEGVLFDNGDPQRNEAPQMYTALGPLLSPGHVVVGYIPGSLYLGGSRGPRYIQGLTTQPLRSSFIVISIDAVGKQALAHELGHRLSGRGNEYDEAGAAPYLLFPNAYTGADFRRVTGGRRIQEEYLDLMRDGVSE
jgi:hypothetical protein